MLPLLRQLKRLFAHRAIPKAGRGRSNEWEEGLTERGKEIGRTSHKGIGTHKHPNKGKHYITRLLKSSIFFISPDTLTPNAPAISCCFAWGSEEKVSHRLPSMIAYA